MEALWSVAGEGLLGAEDIHHEIFDDKEVHEEAFSLLRTDHSFLVFEHESQVDLKIFLFLLFKGLFFALDNLLLDFPVKFVTVQDEEFFGLSFDISDQISNFDDLSFDDFLDFHESLILQKLWIILPTPKEKSKVSEGIDFR